MESKVRVVGKSEKLGFPELDYFDVPARIDTGAYTSAIWASKIQKYKSGRLGVVFFGEGSPLYDGKVHYFDTYEKTIITSSTGDIQERYKVKLLIKFAKKKVRGEFTLADRSTQVYPVLVGRKILRGRFVVDVERGVPSNKADRERARELRRKLRLAAEKEQK
jgi:hypothetical protein